VAPSRAQPNLAVVVGRVEHVELAGPVGERVERKAERHAEVGVARGQLVLLLDERLAGALHRHVPRLADAQAQAPALVPHEHLARQEAGHHQVQAVVQRQAAAQVALQRAARAEEGRLVEQKRPHVGGRRELGRQLHQRAHHQVEEGARQR